AKAIALSIKRGLAENLGPWVRCSIGIAGNRYLAKVATDLEKPDGLTILMPEDVEHRLTTLSLRDLPGIGANMERRLQRYGLHSVADIFALDRRFMRHVWGSVWGERMWYLLRGYDLPELETRRGSIGHSHVLGPELRPAHQAIAVARRLTLKACSRLRRMQYHATLFGFAARMEDGRRFRSEGKCLPAQDSKTFLDMLLCFWDHHLARAPDIQVKKISVVLYGLVADANVQPDLFEALKASALHKGPDVERWNRLSHALDRINHRFGRDSALIGILPSQGKSFSGTKIAFTRIPDREEFLE
ncbi:MAG: type VI secretion protein ImpB, partial [Sphingorhabdus sp.]